MYFWRTLQQQAIDYLEEADGQLHGYEFKWRKAKHTVPKAFRETYPASAVQQVKQHLCGICQLWTAKHPRKAVLAAGLTAMQRTGSNGVGFPESGSRFHPTNAAADSRTEAAHSRQRCSVIGVR